MEEKQKDLEQNQKDSAPEEMKQKPPKKIPADEAKLRSDANTDADSDDEEEEEPISRKRKIITRKAKNQSIDFT